MLNEYFEWRHLRIHVQERGEGEPLLLIGVGMIALIWFGPRLIGRLRR